MRSRKARSKTTAKDSALSSPEASVDTSPALVLESVELAQLWLWWAGEGAERRSNEQNSHSDAPVFCCKIHLVESDSNCNAQ